MLVRVPAKAGARKAAAAGPPGRQLWPAPDWSRPAPRGIMPAGVHSPSCPETAMSQFNPLRLVVKSLDVLASQLPARLTRAPVSDTGAHLSPLLHWMLHLRRLKNGSADMITDDPAQARRLFRADMKLIARGYPVREVRALSIPGPAGAMPARHYRPEAAGELPALLVFLHGGGFMIGDLDTHDDACRLLCRETGMQVLSVDYRLAPEHVFPAAAEDAEAAVRWAQQNAAQFGVAPTAIAVGGDSAGGNLSTVVAQRLAKSGTPLLAQLLIYPATDMVTPRASQQLFGEGFFLSFADREWFEDSYVGHDKALRGDVGASPLLNEEPGVLAPALLITSGFDVLRDEGEAYVGHLRAHGTSVEHIRFEHLGHGFINLAGAHRDSELATMKIARQFRLLCNRVLALGATAATAKPAAASAVAKKKPAKKKAARKSTPV
jgi:acetyl esterase